MQMQLIRPLTLLKAAFCDAAAALVLVLVLFGEEIAERLAVVWSSSVRSASFHVGQTVFAAGADRIVLHRANRPLAGLEMLEFVPFGTRVGSRMKFWDCAVVYAEPPRQARTQDGPHKRLTRLCAAVQADS